MELKAVCNIESEDRCLPPLHTNMIDHSTKHNMALYLALPSAE